MIAVAKRLGADSLGRLPDRRCLSGEAAADRDRIGVFLPGEVRSEEDAHGMTGRRPLLLKHVLEEAAYPHGVLLSSGERLSCSP